MGGTTIIIHASFMRHGCGEGETHLSRVLDNASHPFLLSSLSPHTQKNYNGNSDRGFTTHLPLEDHFYSSFGGFTLSDYNDWSGCTIMFSKPPQSFFRNMSASTHLSSYFFCYVNLYYLKLCYLLQNCYSYTKLRCRRLLHTFAISYLNLSNV